MTSPDGSTQRSPSPPPPPAAISHGPAVLPRIRSPERATERRSRPFSEFNLPIRRSSATLSTLLTSSSLNPSSKRASSPILGTPVAASTNPPAFPSPPASGTLLEQNPYRNLAIRSFAPHVSLLPSSDTEELVAQKGFQGGFLELVRPYGDSIQGKVTIRDSTGSSRSWEDYAIRFTRPRDGLEPPRAAEDSGAENALQHINGVLDQTFPGTAARMRTGGDVGQIEDLIDRHLSYAEYSDDPPPASDEEAEDQETGGPSPFASPYHLLYLHRLFSGLPLAPHETFSHPVACVIAVSSRNDDPIEEIRNLQARLTTGDDRFPLWVNNDYLRYYLLVHDEDHDDIQRSTMFFDQMKRHFGLHCHLLRLRSTQCVASDDDGTQLPQCEWITAAEELWSLEKQENLIDMEDDTKYLFESDESAIKGFVREMVTQSIIPMMERMCAQWNDQVASKRRGLSGRFMSLSKKWTPFGSSNRNSSSAAGGSGSSGSNYDSLQGFYRPDAPEAVLRKLGDYAFMLRDFRLAQATYELLRNDYSNDKAWKYYAGANEMMALTFLINPQPTPLKSKSDTLDQLLEAACYSYTTRSNSPYYALRALAIALELLLVRGGSVTDAAAQWAWRLLELDLVGPVGHALFAERIAACHASRKATGTKQWGSRRRKSALWSVLATEAWLDLDKNRQAEKCLGEVFKIYHINPKEPSGLMFEGMRILLEELRDLIATRKGSSEIFDTMIGSDMMRSTPAVNQDDVEKVDIRDHRKSLIGISTAPSQLLDVSPSVSGAQDGEEDVNLRGRSDS